VSVEIGLGEPEQLSGGCHRLSGLQRGLSVPTGTGTV
jgi:hypothetical protein